MKWGMTGRRWQMRKLGLWVGVLMMAGTLVTCTGLAAADQPAPVQNAVGRLAAKLGVTADQVQVVSAELVEWPDASLGCPRPGMAYAQVVTGGYKVMLSAQGKRYEYHTDMRLRAVLAKVDGQPAEGATTQSQAVPPVAQPCVADLAQRLKIPAAGVKVLQVKAVTFPDSSLGLPRPGEMYAQAVTPGQIVLLVAKQVAHLYATAGDACRYGGPLSARGCSALYLEPAGDEANMNANLVQVSLAGTNPTVIMKLVDGFRPQADGSITATRRTSRSGYDLLYLAPGATDEPIRLASGLYFGDAAVKAETKRWAAFCRPGLGSGWRVSWGALAPSKGGGLDAFLGDDKTSLALPEGATPARMYWHMTNPVAAVTLGDKTAYFELTLDAAKPEWRKLGSFFFPPSEEFMLNKSESLMVETQTDANGKPVTKVGTRWFTGDEHPVATIADFTPSEITLSPGHRFVFLYGKRGEQGLALAVSMQTGEVLTTVEASNTPVRLLSAPAQGWIWSQLKSPD